MDPIRTREAAACIVGVIDGIRSEGPTPAEIQKAQNAVESQYYFGQSDVLGVASNLAYYEALGDYRLADAFIQKLREVTPEAVLRSASAYLTLENASLLEYLPEGTDWGAPGALEVRRSLEAMARPLVPSLPDLPEITRRPPAPGSASLGPTPPRRLSLPGGATLLVEESPWLPVTSVVVLFRDGRLQETEDNMGISRLTLATMGKGTMGRDALRIATEMESFGCSLERLYDDDYLGFSFGILSRFLPGGMDLLLDVIRNAAFDPTEVERERKVQLAAIESLKDQSLGYTLNLFREAAYPGHPYALPAYGAPSTVKRLNARALREWHRRIFRPDRMVVAVVGDLSASSVRDMLAERMEGWTAEGPLPSEVHAVTHTSSITERVETRKRTQTFQIIGFPACDLRSQAKYPLDLLQSAVSGLGGRFFEAIRGKRGLAYVVAAMNYAKRLGGSFVVYLGTAPEKELEARAILMDEIGKIRLEGLPEEEIFRSRSYLLGSHAISLQASQARALSYAAAEIQEQGMEEVEAYPQRIREVASEKVLGIAREVLTPECYALGVLRGG